MHIWSSSCKLNIDTFPVQYVIIRKGLEFWIFFSNRHRVLYREFRQSNSLFCESSIEKRTVFCHRTMNLTVEILYIEFYLYVEKKLHNTSQGWSFLECRMFGSGNNYPIWFRFFDFPCLDVVGQKHSAQTFLTINRNCFFTFEVAGVLKHPLQSAYLSSKR